MEKIKILIKEYKSCDRKYIRILFHSTGKALYSLIDTMQSIDEPIKSIFNKSSFIKYLKGCQIPKKYIKQLENIQE